MDSEKDDIMQQLGEVAMASKMVGIAIDSFSKEILEVFPDADIPNTMHILAILGMAATLTASTLDSKVLRAIANDDPVAAAEIAKILNSMGEKLP